MQQETTEEVLNFLSQCKDRYEKDLKEKLELKSRLRKYVERRTAFVMAVRPYATLKNIGATIEKDHSTLVHSIRSHDTHIAFSPSYRNNYSIALNSVHHVSELTGFMPYNNPPYIEDLLRQVHSLREILNHSERRVNKFLQEQEEKRFKFYLKTESKEVAL